MGKITLDPELKTKLNGLNDTFEVCDEAGQTVGHFLPAALYKELMYAWAKAQFSDAEIAQARKEMQTEPGYTTAEALAVLAKRAAGMAKGKS